jgi:hypothetical protein
MMSGKMAALVVAASVLTASVLWAAGHPSPQSPAWRLAGVTGPRQRGAPAAPSATERDFQFRGLMFTIPASWDVQRADRQRFRMEFVTVTGRPSGPRLTFSDTVELVATARGGRPSAARNGRRLSFQRLEMPNAMGRGVVYVFPEAGVTLSAQVRTDADVRAADAVAESARWAIPIRGPVRS